MSWPPARTTRCWRRTASARESPPRRPSPAISCFIGPIRTCTASVNDDMPSRYRTSVEWLCQRRADAGSAVAIAAIKEPQLAVLLDDVGIGGHLAFPTVAHRRQRQVVAGRAALPVQ